MPARKGDLLDDTIDEVVLLRVPRHVLEGQYGERRLDGRRGAQSRRADLCQINDLHPRAAFDLFLGRQRHHLYSKNAALVSNISRKVARRAGPV
jgi:hypothetical protein